MDFTGKVGRICENGELSSAASVGRCYTSKDGYAYFRRRVSPKEVEPLLTDTQATAHSNMPWFHRGVGRDVAQRILAAHSVDG